MGALYVDSRFASRNIGEVGSDILRAIATEAAQLIENARLVQAEVDRAHVQLTLVPALAAKMDAMIARGHGKDDWTVIAKDFTS